MGCILYRSSTTSHDGRLDLDDLDRDLFDLSVRRVKLEDPPPRTRVVILDRGLNCRLLASLALNDAFIVWEGVLGEVVEHAFKVHHPYR